VVVVVVVVVLALLLTILGVVKDVFALTLEKNFDLRSLRYALRPASSRVEFFSK
jgi:hypothetical protein